MRAKQSTTALENFSRTGTLTAPIPIRAAGVEPPPAMAIRKAASVQSTKATRSVAQGEGLLHDVRNLMGAIGLYSDLLALPGVLKPEHAHYADELRLLGTRSGRLIERLLHVPALHTEAKEGPALVRTTGPVSLRQVVERCSGLLSQVAGGRRIEVSYGPAASAPIAADQEDIERILVNLVSNSAAALDGREGVRNERSPVRVARERTADQPREAIHIAIGVLQSRVGDARPWPFRRVRLTVEDFGCGMTPEQLERLLRGSRSPSRGNRGIGFRVVRELVEAGGGDLRVMSAAGLGTRVQIEWPAAVIDNRERGNRHRENLRTVETDTDLRRVPAGDGRGTAC